MKKFNLKDYCKKGVYEYDFLNDETELSTEDAITAKCLDCVCYDIKEAYNCEDKHCPLVSLNHKYVKNRI